MRWQLTLYYLKARNHQDRFQVLQACAISDVIIFVSGPQRSDVLCAELEKLLSLKQS